MSTTNQIRRSYKNDQSVCIIACHGIVTKIRHVFGDTFSCRAAPPDILGTLRS